ncbi:MAG: DUF2007 domain-containing protein [Tannerellaceae bacterium]
MNTLVTIAEFNQPNRALFLKSLLEAEGIQCFLKDELTSQIYGTGIMFGGVKLQVLDTDVEAATRILIAGGFEEDSVQLENQKEELESSKTIFSKVPYIGRLSYPAQMWIILILTIALGLLLGLISYFINSI